MAAKCQSTKKNPPVGTLLRNMRDGTMPGPTQPLHHAKAPKNEKNQGGFHKTDQFPKLFEFKVLLSRVKL